MPIHSAATAIKPLRIPALLSRGLQAAWSRGLAEEPTLQPGALIDAAAAREGASPAEGSWREALDLLTTDLQEAADLNALGRTTAHGQIVAILRQRIRAAALWARNPGILDLSVKAPVIILGHMRSGTTRLQRLLACDPLFTYTRLHESMSPLSQPARAIASAAAVRAILGACNPELRRIHPSSPRAPEEEFGLHAISLHGSMFEAQWHVPRFTRWSEDRDLGDVYREFRRLVQTLRWKRGDSPNRIQLLKAPHFMQELDALLSAFPDARIVYIERDLQQVVPSGASLVWHQQRVQSDSADRVRIGPEWLRKTRLRQERATDALRRHSHVPQLRVDYSAMDEDWQSELRRIYDFLGTSLEPAVLDKMRAVTTKASHHGHTYALEQFGLDARTVAGVGESARRENGGRGKD